MQPIAILATGMVTGVGLNAPASCAAIRCGLTNFAETRFMDSTGEWIVGSEVPLEKPWRGRAKLVHMVAPAIQECLDAANEGQADQIPLLLCVAEKTRPGRLEGLDDKLLDEVQSELGVIFHSSSHIIPEGRVGGALAIKEAEEILYQRHLPYCVVAGADSYLVAGTLTEYENRERILTPANSNGFIPGEAGAAVLLGTPSYNSNHKLIIPGIGFGTETATIESEEPLRADGLVQAIKESLTDSNLKMADLDYRITDISGEQYGFKEASLALTRILRDRKEEFDIWHPADCIGEVGASIGPVMLAVLSAALQKNYSPGRSALAHFANDEGRRAAMTVTFHFKGTA
jgi:3-oxoacyl-[acyl-carrier-protein] synthase-1